MGTLFKAATGLAIAWILLPGAAHWPDFTTLKGDLAAARPAARVEAWLMPQTGTPAGAQRLHLPTQDRAQDRARGR
ncbi:MAG TPA: hypothetical protein VG889_12685 [Rhizomicrobium sp.]|nr:hypothetical protein [Rhizomicrobium sp.]